jgi:hypothetical protein
MKGNKSHHEKHGGFPVRQIPVRQPKSFFPKSKKPIKAVIRHLLHKIPAEDISDGLVSLGFDVVSVKQMTATRHCF